MARKALEVVNEFRATQEKLKPHALASPSFWHLTSFDMVKVNYDGANLVVLGMR